MTDTAPPSTFVALVHPVTPDAQIDALARDEGWVEDGDRTWMAPDRTTIRLRSARRTGEDLRWLEVDGDLEGSHRVVSAVGTYLRVRGTITVLRAAEQAVGTGEQTIAVWELATVFVRCEPSALAPLERFYTTGEESLRTEIVDAIAWRRWPEAQPLLERIAREDAALTVQASAALAAWIVGQPEGAAYVVLLPDDTPDQAVRAVATAALWPQDDAATWRPEPGTTVRLAYHQELRSLVVEGPPGGQQAVIRALGELWLRDWLQVLHDAEACSDERRPALDVREVATVLPRLVPRAAAHLERFYNEGGVPLRTEVLDAWSRWPEARPWLVRAAASDPDPGIRQRAAALVSPMPSLP